MTEITGKRAARLTEVNDLESELRARRKALSDLHEKRGKEEVRQTQMQLKIESLAEHVMRRYQVDLREFAPDRYAFTKTLRAQLKQRGKSEGETITDGSTDLNEAELREVINQLTRQLDAMGPVNLDAVHEYELEERHTFLETQNADLTNSRRELLEVINEINQTTRKLFAETFAQIRINFQEMFKELFGGGQADLMLTNDDDPLNCGIEIIAKPPGKQIASGSLLSGGERTMTAVALLFAIYMVGHPFCVLDEMDAPLDESNINRFIRVLDRFVGKSQFVVISHNKRTIADGRHALRRDHGRTRHQPVGWHALNRTPNPMENACPRRSRLRRNSNHSSSTTPPWKTSRSLVREHFSRGPGQARLRWQPSSRHAQELGLRTRCPGRCRSLLTILACSA